MTADRDAPSAGTPASRVVLNRLNRRLERDGQAVRSNPAGSKRCAENGNFSLVDLATDAVLERNVDVQAMCRSLGLRSRD